MFLGYSLKHHVFYEQDVVDELVCAHLCLTNTGRCPSCKSVNLEKNQNSKGKRKCQLNVETEENVYPEDLVLDAVFDYWELQQVRSTQKSASTLIQPLAPISIEPLKSIIEATLSTH